MHIQERTNTTLTTCTKMTEEVDRRHGVNGNSGGKTINEDIPVHSPAHTLSGGRLKFFKDGKFILELVQGCVREGEREGWVSVPRKTFWPPAAAPAPVAPHPPRNERAASLSVSDDNSSIQSSPWQRDHCWKQSSPRKNISKELALYYCRPNTLLNSAIAIGSRLKRRRPYDATRLDSTLNGFKRTLTNGVCIDKKKNGDTDPAEGANRRSRDAADAGAHHADGAAADDDYDRDKYHYMKLKKPYQYHKLRVYKKSKQSTRRKDIVKISERLRERIASLPLPLNAKLATCKAAEHAMVSPRKRILRELERVSLEEQSGKRRAKPAPALSTASYPPPPSPSPSPSSPSPGPSRAAHKPCAYSISSLLGEDPPRRPSPAPSPAPAPRAPPRDHLYVYGYTPYLPPQLYSRSPAPLWMPYAAPPGAWPPPPRAHPLTLLADRLPRDEPISDLPLNLSKH